MVSETCSFWTHDSKNFVSMESIDGLDGDTSSSRIRRKASESSGQSTMFILSVVK